MPKDEKQSIDINFVEKRQHPRFNIHCLANVEMIDKTLEATAIDISEGGVGLIIPHHFSIGEVIKLQIRFQRPAEKKSTIETKAKVIWVGKENEKKLYSCGLEFMNISNNDIE
ncbi:MAG: PilZ domain-containing protein, partial [Candidatus Aureabacteria bacterium]|nr:PilZ domain-containing protein [Candidatus Auribacterota bacterium]